MRYNLAPFLDLLTPEIPSHDVWRDRLTNFFNDDKVNPNISDLYYDILINDHHSFTDTLRCGYLIDQYSGLFTFDSYPMKGYHTFNLANYIRRNHQLFYNKKIKTITKDYGIVNIQIKLCGLNLVRSGVEYSCGFVLADIGNQAYSYPMNFDDDYDVIFVAHAFDTDEGANIFWNGMLEDHLRGKEVYFTSKSFQHLQNHILYDKIKQVEDPTKIYDDLTYSNGDLGFMNKIYKIA